MLQKFLRNFRYGYYPKYLQNYIFHTIDYENSFDPFEIKWSKYYLEDYWLKESSNCRVHWLHNLNKVRIPCIYETYFTPNDLEDYTLLEPKEEFKKMKILDVGCGGGICSEALAELNFNVTGIDPNPDMIVIAKDHAKQNPLLRGKNIEYYHTTIEDFYPQNLAKFDAVVISEVIDRIPHRKKRKFLQKCVNCVKVDGDIFITTRNRTVYSFLLLALFAIRNGFEFGHLKWHRAISHYLLKNHLTHCGCTVRRTRGLHQQMLDGTFTYQERIDGWYFMHAIRNKLIL